MAEKRLALAAGATMPGGIGRATALALAREGYDVLVTGFNHKVDFRTLVSGAVRAAQTIVL